MSARYRVKRKYEFSPILLSNGCKVSLAIHETANSYKIIYDKNFSTSTKEEMKCSPYSITERKAFPCNNEYEIDDRIHTNINGKQDENLVLKRRHYFDNTADRKEMSDSNKLRLKKFSPNACWELHAKPFSVQELSDKFETINESYTPLSYKSVTKLFDRKLTFLISARKTVEKLNNNNTIPKRHFYPFRSKPLGLNIYENNLSNSQDSLSLSKTSTQSMIDDKPKKPKTGRHGSSSLYSSNMYIPFENSKIKNGKTLDVHFLSKFITEIPQFCYSSINLSGIDNIISNKLSDKSLDYNNKYGSSKSIESLFCNSQNLEMEDLKKEKFNDFNNKILSPKIKSPNGFLVDYETSQEFTESIRKVKSQLRSIRHPEPFNYNNVHKLKRSISNKFDKKIKFFENLSSTPMLFVQASSNPNDIFFRRVNTLPMQNRSIFNYEYKSKSSNIL